MYVFSANIYTFGTFISIYRIIGKMKTDILKYSWIPLIISLIIFYLCCLIPTEDVPIVEFDFFIPLDKIFHFSMFFGLSAATGLYYVHDKKGRINWIKLWIGVIIFPVLYGGLIEILQDMFFYPRTGDWFDFLADATGSFTALIPIYYYRNYLLRTA